MYSRRRFIRKCSYLATASSIRTTPCLTFSPPANGYYSGTPGLGYHVLNWLEIGATNYTWLGDNGQTFMQAVDNPVATMFANIGIYSGSQPSLIVSNWGAWTDYHNALSKNERYDRPQQNSDLAKSGFRNLMYRNAVWITDALAPRASNVETVYLIDESALNIYWDPRRDFFHEPWRKPYNQSTRVSYIKNRLELIFRERRSSGVITVTAAL